MITDRSALKGRSLTAVVGAAIKGGANVIQLRDKKADDHELARQARLLLRVTRPAGIPLIINDRPRVAKAVRADGVHLGQGDASLSAARKILGKNAIIGRSTHTRRQALLAQQQGFDYIAVGPVFRTPTKPTARPAGLGLVRFAAKKIRVPFVAIGGIDAFNAAAVREAGAKAIAAVRAIMGAADPKAAAKSLRGPGGRP